MKSAPVSAVPNCAASKPEPEPEPEPAPTLVLNFGLEVIGGGVRTARGSGGGADVGAGPGGAAAVMVGADEGMLHCFVPSLAPRLNCFLFRVRAFQNPLAWVFRLRI